MSGTSGYRGPVYRCGCDHGQEPTPDAVALAAIQLRDDEGALLDTVLVPLCDGCAKGKRADLTAAVEAGWRPTMEPREEAA